MVLWKLEKKKTPKIIADNIEGIPVVSNYKYLGVTIDDCLKFDVELSKKIKMG